jgi:hypothetical protein
VKMSCVHLLPWSSFSPCGCSQFVFALDCQSHTTWSARSASSSLWGEETAESRGLNHLPYLGSSTIFPLTTDTTYVHVTCREAILVLWHKTYHIFWEKAHLRDINNALVL